MAFTEFIKVQITKKLDEYCSQVPEHVKHQLKHTYSIRGNEVTLFEERLMRPEQWSKMPIAKLKYDPEKNNWSLWWSDSKDQWHDYFKEIKCSKNPGTLDAILEEIEKDPKGIFWG